MEGVMSIYITTAFRLNSFLLEAQAILFLQAESTVRLGCKNFKFANYENR